MLQKLTWSSWKNPKDGHHIFLLKTRIVLMMYGRLFGEVT